MHTHNNYQRSYNFNNGVLLQVDGVLMLECKNVGSEVLFTRVHNKFVLREAICKFVKNKCDIAKFIEMQRV